MQRSEMRGVPGWKLCTLLLLFALPSKLHADPQEIEDGEPVTLEDAFTDPPGQLSLQYSGSYERSRSGVEQELTEQGPTFKLGVVRGVQVSLNPNYDTGTAQGRNAGFLLSDVLVQLTRQTRLLPAFAIDVFNSVPFGSGHKSTGYVVRAIASKFLGESEAAPRLHLNITDYHLVQPDMGGRRDQLQFVAGASFLVSPRDAIVADIVAGQSEQAGHTETFLEIGYSRDLPDDWTFQLGIGHQVAGGGSATRVFFAVEKEFKIF